MAIYVQGLSALAHYRSSNARTDVEHCTASVRALSNASSSLADAIDSGVWRLGIGNPTPETPLEVLVKDKSQRSGSKSIRPRIWKDTVPAKAFRTVRKGLYVSSPEFVFLQMATRLDLPELVELGMELCGTYRRDVEAFTPGSPEPTRMTAYNQSPLTTLRRLRGFIVSMKSAPGGRRALRAIDYVLPNSASPMETALYLLLCLPRRLGGYALPKPELNPPIILTRAGKRFTIRSSARPDLYWRSAHLDLEYNSDEFHDEDQRAADSMRRKALERMNVEVIELTKQELFSTEIFHAIVLRIARRLGKRIRSETEGAFFERRATLRKLLLTDNDRDQDASERARESRAEDSAQLSDVDLDLWPDDSASTDAPGEFYMDDVWPDDLQDDSDLHFELLDSLGEDGLGPNEPEGDADMWDEGEIHVFGRAPREIDEG